MNLMLTGLNDYMSEVKAKKQVVGSWGFHSHKDFSKIKPEQANVWFFEQTFNFLRSFFGLVMPDSMEIITYNATKHIKKDNLTQQSFLDEFMLSLKGLKEYIWTFRLNLSIVGFIRSHHDPDNTIRVQIQEPSSFIIWGGPEETGFQTFNISYNLFNAASLKGGDEMLWSVNQPLLEKALHKWERQTGKTIEVVKGNVGAQGGEQTRYGFKRPGVAPRRPAGARPRAPGQAAGVGQPVRRPAGARPIGGRVGTTNPQNRTPSPRPTSPQPAPQNVPQTPSRPASPAAKPRRPAGARPIRRPGEDSKKD